MDFADIKSKSVKELQNLLATWREDLRALRFKAHGRELKQVNKIGELKTQIAQSIAILAEKIKAK